jgi:hypothetical protein
MFALSTKLKRGRRIRIGKYKKKLRIKSRPCATAQKKYQEEKKSLTGVHGKQNGLAF